MHNMGTNEGLQAVDGSFEKKKKADPDIDPTIL